MSRPVTLVATSDWPGRFPTLRMGAYTSALHQRSVRGTSRASGRLNGVGMKVGDGGESATRGGMGEHLLG